jgi:hypothetical protein
MYGLEVSPGSWATDHEILTPYIDLPGDFRTMARIELLTPLAHGAES